MNNLEQPAILTDKELVSIELAKCAQDYSYALKKYAIIQHPIDGKVPFNLYDFQEKTLQMFIDEDEVIILKGRQLGISTLVSGYIAMEMSLKNDFNTLVISKDGAAVQGLIKKTKIMLNSFPSWLQSSKHETDNKTSIELSNGSVVKSVAPGPDAGRTEALSLLVLDECIGGDTQVTIRNKNTGEIRIVNIEDIYNNDEYE